MPIGPILLKTAMPASAAMPALIIKALPEPIITRSAIRPANKGTAVRADTRPRTSDCCENATYYTTPAVCAACSIPIALSDSAGTNDGTSEA